MPSTLPPLRSCLPLLLFTLLPLFLEGQTIEKSFGLELAPHAGGRRISGGADVAFQRLEAQDSIENGVGGFGIGILFESRVDKIGFTTGIRYLRTGYESMLESDEGPGLGQAVREEVTAQYLSFPLELNFLQDISERDRFSFTLGLAAHVHLNTVRQQVDFFDGEQIGTSIVDDSNVPYRPVVLSLNTGVAYDRKIGENWSVKFQPFFQFFLQGNLETNFDLLNRNYYQTGVRVVVRRLFF